MMDINNVQSLTALVNVIDTLVKSGDEGQILSVSISRYSSTNIQLSYELFMSIFKEYEESDSVHSTVYTHVNGVEVCALVPAQLKSEVQKY